MIKLLWIACSIPVFVYTLKYCIKEELEAYDDLDPLLLILMIIISFLVASFGPLAIVAYICYTVIADIAEGISERHQNNIR